MPQDTNERNFSRQKYRSGCWRTTSVPCANPIVRRGIRLLSFKHQCVDELARKCNPDFTVVDFGCGIGSYSHFFLCHCPSTLCAIDWSPEALGRIPKPKKGNLFRICADLHFLPLKSSTVDALFSVDTLGHCKNQELALDEINRICRSGAPLFLHSECSDFRRHWPDRLLVKKDGSDCLSDIDGHFSIRPSTAMRSLYEQRFSLKGFFSPRGILAWCIGYPEKYCKAFRSCGNTILTVITCLFSTVKSLPGMKPVFRCMNTFSNRCELFLGIEGGGSCFAHARTSIPRTSNIPRSSLSVDIILPTYGRAGLLRNTVEALLSQCKNNDHIYIVWQGLEKPVFPRDKRLQLVYLRRPNLPAARNKGLNAGGNPIVLFLDDDISPGSGLLDAHRNCYTNPSTAAVAGYVDDPLFSDTAAVPSYFDYSTGELRQHFALSENQPSISVMGANMSFNREILESIGGFDTHYRHNALWEEIDVSFRLLKRGYSIDFCANAQITHHRHPEGGCRTDHASSYLFHQFANTAYFACSYAPVDKIFSWISFWKYRLEFLSRTATGTLSSPGRSKHRPVLVLSGLTGALAGIARFMTCGRRIGLPEIIYHQNDSVSP